MKRFLAIVFLTLVVVVVAASILWGGTRFSSFSDNEELITAFLLTSVELIGLVVSIAVAIFIVYQYIQFRRPYRLVFEAFSNESKLVDSGKKPLNLSILAQEELARQLKSIYRDLKGYADKDSQDFEALVADELYFGKDPSENDIRSFVSIGQLQQAGIIEDLKEVIKDLEDPKGINLMHLVGEIAPQEVTPITKFIEAIFPPHVVRATGHLQGKCDQSDRVGVTFEFVDIGSQRNLMVRTLRWEPSNDSKDPIGPALSAESNIANETQTNERPDHYIDLLSPAMYWVALMFLEQKLISHVPLKNRLFKALEKRRKARIFYLIGALYYAHAQRLEAYSRFFCQLAVEHLRLALITDRNWVFPYRYLANLYSFKALVNEGELHEKLLKEACNLYDQGLALTKRKEQIKKGQKFTHARIRVAKALAELSSGIMTFNQERINQAIQDVKYLETLMNPSDFDAAEAEECAVYFYSLASWYRIAFNNAVPIPNAEAENEARRYLEYCLACSQDFWDTVEKDINFERMRKAGDLKELKQELSKKLSEEGAQAGLAGEHFKKENGNILEKINQLLRPVDKQKA